MRSLFYMVVLLVVTGCGMAGSQPRVLDEAQSLLQSDPSAALSKLNGVDVSEFQDSATMARWALLYMTEYGGCEKLSRSRKFLNTQQ